MNALSAEEVQEKLGRGGCLITTSRQTPYKTLSVRVERLTVGEWAVALDGAAASPILP